MWPAVSKLGATDFSEISALTRGAYKVDRADMQIHSLAKVETRNE